MPVCYDLAVRCDRCSCILLLRLLRCVACAWLCWYPDEEGVLRSRAAWSACFRRHRHSRKLPPLYRSTEPCTDKSQITAKYFFIRTLRGTHHLNHNTAKHWIVWFSLTGAVSLTAYIIASAIPVFGGLVSLVGALLGTLMCFQPMGCMWLYDNWGRSNRDWKWKGMVAWSVFVIVSGTFLLIGGTYGSIVGIMDSYQKNGGTKPWTCADNSNSSGGH